ncbi:hypothetical protein LKO27_09610 [Tessaracoccus sp. OS52]|uniref:hypothetical protein n=1 Tax=Tessaracoccus sp. OS52 TaxID=2886691 RepID=UPI001D12EA94|nr:hypothetical protein [Tessaracoccus sp. OS52]MCC2593659.1 hypothetical protein [Tessaracoccus sp. OS52]
MFRSVLVTVLMGTHHYASSVADMADPTAFGAAVCGTVTDDIGDELRCVVAGSSATLETGSADIEYLTIEELAAFTNELHEQL